VPLSLNRLPLVLAELPYTSKNVLAPLLDRLAFAMARRPASGWLLVRSSTLVMVIGAMALLRPSSPMRPA